MILSWALVPGRSWAPPMEGSQMTYVLVLAVVLNGAPMLVPRSTDGEITNYASRAACEQEVTALKPQLTPRITTPFRLVCVTRQEWDAIPNEFNEMPRMFRIAPSSPTT
jgi:hypothetical protein